VKPNNDKLHVGGRIVSYSNAYWSDRRIKDSISIIDSSLINKLLYLKPVTYRFKIGTLLNPINFDSSSIDSSTTAYKAEMSINKYLGADIHFGLIAQDVKEIYPNLVNTSDNGALTLNYNELLPLLIKGYQNQQRQLLEQKALIQLQLNTTIHVANKSVLYQNDPN
jgi:hypothetical protein